MQWAVETLSPVVDAEIGALWELRITGRDGISRAIYVTAQRRRIVIVRVFIKKTQKTPLRELALARQRAKDVT